MWVGKEREVEPIHESLTCGEREAVAPAPILLLQSLKAWRGCNGDAGDCWSELGRKEVAAQAVRREYYLFQRKLKIIWLS